MSPRVSVLGDSISTLAGWVPEGWRVHYGDEVLVSGVDSPANTWWGIVAAALGGEVLANSSYSGSVVEGFGFPAGCSPERARALLGPGGEGPDLVLILMGINDYGWGGGRNQVMGGSPSASASPEELGPPFSVERSVGMGAVARFEEAYRAMLRNVHIVAPGAEIWCVDLCPGSVEGRLGVRFKYRIRSMSLDAYNEAISRAASAEGAHLADVRALGLSYDSVDGAHPTAAGMRQLAGMVLRVMGVFGHEELLEGSLPAPEPCSRGACPGCPLADKSPGRWTICCGL